MKDDERIILQNIIELLRSSNGIFDISLSPEECIILLKYIDYIRDLKGE